MTAGTAEGAIVDPVATILDGLPLKAASFIVTLYGDVIAPRGGDAWIGNIIETCAAVGISETLVRTAVSRLVSAGRLEGRREGRRSFYRLAPAAENEFAIASRAIYGFERPAGWRFVYLPEGQAEALMPQLERMGLARLKPQLAVGTDRLALPEGVLSFRAEPEGGHGHLTSFVASAWDLASHAQSYHAFVERFAPLVSAAPAPDTALTLRLALVHVYRAALLADPRLPPDALPVDWPGHKARRLFARLYTALSPAADSHIGARFQAFAGPLATHNPAIEARLAQLAHRTAHGKET